MKKMILLLVPLLVLAACAGGTKRDADDHNDADVAFVQQMIPHHRQAVEMTTLVAAAGASDQVRDLAGRVEAAQMPEIDRMQQLLEQWGVDEADGHGGDHGPGMTGMMSDSQMTELAAARGEVFSRLWTSMMIEHHRGAIEMARTELAEGQDPEARKIARAIVDGQQTEIDEMETFR